MQLTGEGIACSLRWLCSVPVSSVEVPGLPVEVSRERLELHPADGVGGASLGPADEYSIAPRGVREEMVS